MLWRSPSEKSYLKCFSLFCCFTFKTFSEESFQSLTQTLGIFDLKGTFSKTQPGDLSQMGRPSPRIWALEPHCWPKSSTDLNSILHMLSLFQTATRCSQLRGEMLVEKRGASAASLSGAPPSRWRRQARLSRGPRQPPVLCLFLWVWLLFFFFKILRISDTTQCLSFSVWLISRSTVPSRLDTDLHSQDESVPRLWARTMPWESLPVTLGTAGMRRVWGFVKDSKSGLPVQPWIQRTVWWEGLAQGEQGLRALGVISACLGGEDTRVHFTFQMWYRHWGVRTVCRPAGPQ